jgi:hypothetical protein
MTTATKPAPKKKAAPKKAAAKKPARARLSDESKITVLAKENPRRAGTDRAKQFAKYKTGMTVAAAKQAGITAGAIRRDVSRKFISVG